MAGREGLGGWAGGGNVLVRGVADPMMWSPEHVRQWLHWAIKEYNLQGVEPARFDMDGKELCRLQRDDFVRLTNVHNGDVLFAHLLFLRQTPLPNLTSDDVDKALAASPRFQQTANNFCQPVEHMPRFPRGLFETFRVWVASLATNHAPVCSRTHPLRKPSTARPDYRGQGLDGPLLDTQERTSSFPYKAMSVLESGEKLYKLRRLVVKETVWRKLSDICLGGQRSELYQTCNVKEQDQSSIGGKGCCVLCSWPHARHVKPSPSGSPRVISLYNTWGHNNNTVLQVDNSGESGPPLTWGPAYLDHTRGPSMDAIQQFEATCFTSLPG
ncbi:hypothetical protein Bbelb_420870 [Branchiostoma belcheri]|nr:hypothetical protein Bbelb_439990 [Branchiostoma belcheri]KAI8480168.1 hypothetical protein Bbelb_420870 [Branchiostoma belcheri]